MSKQIKSVPTRAVSNIVDTLRITDRRYAGGTSLYDAVAARGGFVGGLSVLFSILATSRPYGSDTCSEFVHRDLVGVLRDFCGVFDLAVDDAGNVIARIGTHPHIMWSCHTDTVHPKHTGFSDLVYNDTYVCSADQRQLGADDGVGIWIMLNLIQAGVHGLYIFHAGEEVGGIGSRHIAKNTPSLLDGITQAIAFDRKGTSSIITVMGCGRVCSDKFAASLGAVLGMGHIADNTGVYTDTAEYSHLVAECTNISAGYYSEHTFGEYLDYQYANRLMKAIIAAAKSGTLYTISTHRDPAEDVYADLYSADAAWYLDYTGNYNGYGTKPRKSGISDITDIVFQNPTAIAELLVDYGFTAEDLLDYVGE